MPDAGGLLQGIGNLVSGFQKQGGGPGGGKSDSDSKSLFRKRIKISTAAPNISDPGSPDKGSDEGAGSYKKGGTVRKTGLAKLHKGEKVLTKSQAKKFGKGKR